MAEQDEKKVLRLKKIFEGASAKSSVPASILAAITSRESRVGALLNDNGFSSIDKTNQGYGLGQIDLGMYSDAAASIIKEAGWNTQKHLELVGNTLNSHFNNLPEEVKQWEPQWQVRAAIASYNFGPANVRTQQHLDRGTTNDDYSADVWARSEYFRQHVFVDN